MNSKHKIVFVAPFLNSFIKNDLDLLSREFTVKTNTYRWDKKTATPLYLIHQFFFFLFRTPSISAVVIQFGGYWSFIPALFGKIYNKPVFIILHGTDCASLPSINYGSFRKIVLRLFCKLSYKFATKLLPVSDSLIKTTNTYSNNKQEELQGVYNHFPKLTTSFTTISNGLEIKKWNTAEPTKEKKSFVSVFTNAQFILKGGDLILQAAENNKSCKFYMVGVNKLDHIKTVPANVFLLGRLEFTELHKYYQKSRFHLQLSIFEGFGLALCEGMLNQCIPIGSSVNAIPHIIGSTGYILEERSLEALQLVINKALTIDNHEELGKAAKERITTLFPIEKRQAKLIETIKEFL